jgi:hypothetical protein
MTASPVAGESNSLTQDESRWVKGSDPQVLMSNKVARVTSAALLRVPNPLKANHL